MIDKTTLTTTEEKPLNEWSQQELAAWKAKHHKLQQIIDCFSCELSDGEACISIQPNKLEGVFDDIVDQAYQRGLADGKI